MHNIKRILFTWELRDKARRKRWFYVNLKRVLEELAEKLEQGGRLCVPCGREVLA